jgi:hypothetical protein
MYIAVLTSIVEGMSGGQQASEASYALGAFSQYVFVTL